MADARRLSPNAGHSSKVSQLSHLEYRVWTTFLLAANDCGIMLHSPTVIQSANWALAQEPADVIAAALQRLIELELVRAYTSQGLPFLCDPRWQDFQRIVYPRQSHFRLPPPEVQSRVSVATRHLYKIFSEHSTKASKQRTNSFRPRARARARNPNANTNPNAVPEERVQGEKPTPTGHRGHAFCGERFCVPRWLDEELARMLGAKAAEFEIGRRYLAWDGELVMSGEAIEPISWVRARLMAEAGIAPKRPYAVRATATHQPQQFTPTAWERDGWRAECHAQHEGQCGSAKVHAARCIAENRSVEVDGVKPTGH